MEKLFSQPTDAEASALYIAYSVSFQGVPRNEPDLLECSRCCLFATEADAELYAEAIVAWWNGWFPSCCMGAIWYATVNRELVRCDGALVHAMSGRTWRFDRLQACRAAFGAWRDADPAAPVVVDAAAGLKLARSMNISTAMQDRWRCWTSNPLANCLLCLLCVPVSVPAVAAAAGEKGPAGTFDDCVKAVSPSICKLVRP